MDDNDSPPLTYSHRAKPYGAEAVFMLRDGLLGAAQGAVDVTIALHEISMIRLTYNPKNSTSEGYQVTVSRPQGRAVTFNNLTFRNVISVDRQDAAYRRFVIGLIEAVVEANPQVVLAAGTAEWKHKLSAVLGAAAVLALAAASLNAASHVSLIITALLGFLTVYFGWWTWRFVSRNRPRVFTADAIPEDVLPKG